MYSCDDGAENVSSPERTTGWPYRLVLAGLHVIGDDDTGLLRRPGIGRLLERPGETGAIDEVRCLFVREEELSLESVLPRGEEVRAEALVIGLVRDRVGAREHSGGVPAQRQLA
jgi:hypothetical protein